MNRSGADRAGWEATPPAGARSGRSGRDRYTGPPSYPSPPRWGFPPVAWRRPLPFAGRPEPDPLARMSALAGTLVPLLRATAAVSVVAAVGEVFRYGLLVRSRDDALPRPLVIASDALVGAGGGLSVPLGVAAVVVGFLWVLRARAAATARTGTASARPDWQVLLGVVTPGINLVVPGSVLAELEHAALSARGAAGDRPRPSRLVLAWWASWAGCLVLAGLAFLWGFRSGTQALADGVLLHAGNDLAVCVLALVTARVVDHHVRLLAPPNPDELPPTTGFRISGAPRAPRSPRPRGSVR